MGADVPLSPRPTLTEEDIQRITEEERLSFRLRSELDPPKEKQSKALTFLSSPFGLFLLGSVLLTGLTALFTQIRSHLRQVEARNQEIIKTTAELKYRLAWVQHFSTEMVLPGNKVSASRFIWYTIRGDPKYYSPSLQEFSGVTTYGLVNKLWLLGVTKGTNDALNSVNALEYGQTQPEGNEMVYPQELLDSQIRTLTGYADSTMSLSIDAIYHRSLLVTLMKD